MDFTQSQARYVLACLIKYFSYFPWTMSISRLLPGTLAGLYLTNGMFSSN